MLETKLPRLLAAAREFNVGQDTLIEFLSDKGFSKDDLKPSSKLSADMYESLQKEFQSDKQAKAKSDAIDLPKGVGSEPRKRREEEEIKFGKEEKKSTASGKEIVGQIADENPSLAQKLADEVEVKTVESAPVAPVAEASNAWPAPEPTVPEPIQNVVPTHDDTVAPPVDIKPVAEEPIPEAKPVVVEQPVAEPVKPAEPQPTPTQPAPEPTPAPVVEPTPIVEAAPETKVEPVENKPTTPEPVMVIAAETVTPPATIEPPAPIRIEAPEIEGPKVITKIDLSKVDSSTKPKKGIKPQPRKAEPSQQQQQHKRQDQTVRTAPPKPQAITPEATAKPAQAAGQVTNQPLVVENIQAKRLEGPKVVGKIELPINSDTRPKPNDREKRKRKRIPIDRKPNTQQPNTGGPGGGGGNRPPGPGGHGNNQSGPGGPGGNRSHGGPNRGPAGRHDPRRTPEEKVIDEKAIQEKLKETQARLSGTNKPGKGRKARDRREKRRERLEGMEESSDNRLLEVTEFISVSELASLMDVSFADVIGKCMGLGIMVSINQRLDAEVIELVASEFNFEVKFVGLEDSDDEEEEIIDDPANLVPRAPIVTIMGHVDHGKTSLLDYVRNANVARGEAGGITQHIGAYEVTTPNGKKVTFLDTPGHEAFTAMRARGAKVTDIAVIVIAADDAVMPQTKEAISHAQAAGVPMVFAINKIDKDGANTQRIYEQLASMNLLVEDWGGKYQSQEISAKQGLNIDLLLEKILLEAEILDLKANPKRESFGTVIEASLDKGRGFVATVLVLNGTLNIGDMVVSGPYFGRIKAMFNERNVRIESAGPSSPALILGLNGAPQAGEKFKEYEEEGDAKSAAYKRGQIIREQGMRARKHITLDEIGRRLALGTFKELNIIIKGDVDGSVEALSDSLQKLSTEEIIVKVILKGVGAISENDVTLANASDAIIMGFNVRPNLQASRLADQEGIEIKQYSVIYNAIADIKSAMEGLLEPKIEEKEVATVEIREVYKFDKATVAGCYVQEGRIKRDAKIRLYRDGVLIYPRTEGAFAELGSLKRFKDDVKDVASNTECGLTLRNFSDLHVGDTIVAIEEEEVKRTL